MKTIDKSNTKVTVVNNGITALVEQIHLAQTSDYIVLYFSIKEKRCTPQVFRGGLINIYQCNDDGYILIPPNRTYVKIDTDQNDIINTSLCACTDTRYGFQSIFVKEPENKNSPIVFDIEGLQ